MGLIVVDMLRMSENVKDVLLLKADTLSNGKEAFKHLLQLSPNARAHIHTRSSSSSSRKGLESLNTMRVTNYGILIFGRTHTHKGVNATSTRIS